MTGPKLRRLRERAGVAASAIAKRADCSTQAVYNFERGLPCRLKGVAIRAAYADLDVLPKIGEKPAPKRPKSSKSDGREIVARVRAKVKADAELTDKPAPVAPPDQAIAWAGVFNSAWLRAQIQAWQREGVTVAVAHRGDTAAASTSVYVATEAELLDLGRRIGAALTGKILQE